MSRADGGSTPRSLRWGPWLGVPFFAWMYGAPVGYVVVLVKTADPAAQWYAMAWVSLAVVIPISGMVVAHLWGVGQWRRRFAVAVLVSLLFAVAGSLAWHAVTAGIRPVGEAPSTTYLQDDCVDTTGARHCPVAAGR
jgi:hypothetical protein